MAPARAAAAMPASEDFVLVDIGAVLVAVPARDVLHGIAWPDPLTGLPRRDSPACGVFDYQGQPLAMLDLALWVKLGAAPRANGHPRALVVRAAGHTVDAVRGLQKFSLDALTRISHDDNLDEIFHSVARGPNGDLANVLDVQRLMALARTWSGSAETDVDDSDVAAPRARAAPQRFALVPGTGCQLAFPVADLVAVIAAPTLARFQSALSDGICQWAGRHLPVTSIAKCWPALASTPVALPPLLAVFERDGLALGVLIDQVPMIRAFHVDAAAVAAAAAAAAAPEQVADGAGVGALTDVDGGVVRLIDMDALYARFPERLLSRVADAAHKLAAGTASSRMTAMTNSSSHILFDAGGMASTPIDGIEAVLSLPPLEAGATHMAWRGEALLLRDLRARAPANANADADADANVDADATAATPTQTPGTVIVVQGAAAPVGFIVDAVHALVQPRAGRISRLALPGQGLVDLLTAESAAGQTTYSTRDLAKLARAPH